MGVDRQVLESAAIEYPAIRLVVQGVRVIQSRGVHVERIGVLHGEAPHAHQTGLGARLVPEFGLDLIPDLRQLLVTPQFAEGEVRDDFLLGHAEAQLPAPAILEAEHIAPDGVPAAAFLPDFGRMEFGSVNLLRPDRIHFLADDPLDLLQRSLG